MILQVNLPKIFVCQALQAIAMLSLIFKMWISVEFRKIRLISAETWKNLEKIAVVGIVLNSIGT